MKHSAGLQSAACCAALIAGGAAQADVTATQVWEDWKAQIGVYGEDTLSIGAEEVSGGTLTVSDFSMSVQDSDVDVAVDFGDISFEEQGDGTVLVTMAESYPVTLKGADGVVVTVLVSQSGLEMVVSGEENAMNYAITADTYTIALQDVVDGDVTFTGDVQLVANDLVSNHDVQTGEMRNVNYDAAMTSFDLVVDIKVPGAEGEYITGGGKVEGMKLQGQSVMPLEANFENPEEMFASGFSIVAGYSIDNIAYIFDVNADGGQVAGSVNTGQTSLDLDISSEAIAYSTLANDLNASITSSDLPFPVELGMGQYGIGFEMPMAKSETPNDFGLSFDLVDLTLSDMIWGVFDPGSVLPRDPATIQFAISGLAKPLIDLMDPAQQAALSGSDMPFELAALTLDNLRVAVAGALLTGEGAFTFDNKDMTSFAPFPKPEGDVVVEISGLNGLLDNLVSMGLVADEDIMAPRMMMGMFARSTGDDQMETKLEVTADGQVLANGQRIR